MARRHWIVLCLLALLPVWFAMGQGAARFPKPNPAVAFGEMKVYNAKGSPVRTPVEDWQGARDRVQNDSAWAAWLRAKQAEVDAWAAEPRDKAEYVAGWWHDFVRAGDGGFLEWTLEPPIEAPPKVFGGWVFGLRSRNGTYMVEAARLWRLTGEQRYFEWAARQLDFYAANYEGWPVQTSKSKARLMHQSLDDANMLVRFVETARLLEGDIPARQQAGWQSRRARWVDALFRPMTLLLDETFQRVHNIACWQRSAMAMAAIYTQDAELWSRAVDGEFGVRRQVRDGITSEYFWLEQSLGYNSYVVSAFVPLFTLAGLHGRLDELRGEAEAVQNLMLAPGQIRFDNGRLPTPADTTGAPRRFPDLALLASASRVFPTRLGLERARQTRGWDTLLDPMAQPPAGEGDTATTASSRNLPSSRFAVLRKDGWQVFFHYGQLDRSHAQAEALNYEAHFGNVDVTHDAGTVGYGSPLHTDYYRQAWAHNAPMVDGQGQQGWHEGELLHFDAPQAVVRARQPRYQAHTQVTRTLSIAEGRLLEQTRITTTDGNSHRLGLVLNLQGKATIPATATPLQSDLFPSWSHASQWTERDVAEVLAVFSGRRFRIRVEGNGAMRMVHATTPDAPPNSREALYVEVEGREAEFRVTWIPE
ncbi:MAG: heparinase II/III family protein [Bryobacterales bacterium]|nr:heparinase II/III family protein [Bryobacterales bacterium]